MVSDTAADDGEPERITFYTLSIVSSCHHCGLREQFDDKLAAREWMTGHIVEEHSDEIPGFSNTDDDSEIRTDGGTSTGGSGRTNVPVFKLSEPVDDPPLPSFTAWLNGRPAVSGLSVKDVVELLSGLRCSECGDLMAHAWHNTPAGESLIGCHFPVGFGDCSPVKITCDYGLYLVYPNQVELEDHRAVMGKYAEDVREMLDTCTTESER